jgi:hypothetical protein
MHTVDCLLNGRLEGGLCRVAVPAHFHVVIHQERMRDTLCARMQMGGQECIALEVNVQRAGFLRGSIRTPTE